MESDITATVDQNTSPDMAIVDVHYCAEPAPKPPREVTFEVGFDCFGFSPQF